MTNSEVNVAIAEFLGLRVTSPRNCSDVVYYVENDSVIKLPDYCTDLNVMHKIEKSLMYYESEWELYTEAVLNEVLLAGGYQDACFLIHASARKRAVAFLKAKGLYKHG